MIADQVRRQRFDIECSHAAPGVFFGEKTVECGGPPKPLMSEEGESQRVGMAACAAVNVERILPRCGSRKGVWRGDGNVAGSVLTLVAPKMVGGKFE
jgi:hypothetical protein